MKAEQLWASILQEAIQGRLVPQLESEPEVEQIGEKPEDVPFDIPEKWKWVFLKSLVQPAKQKKPDRDFIYVDVSSIDNKNHEISNAKFIEAHNAPSRARKIIEEGMVLYATVRPYLKNICIAQQNAIKESIASTAFACMKCKDPLLNKYLLAVLISPWADQYMTSVQKGVAYPAVSDKDFYELLVPLPPIDEQIRICASLDQMKVLINSYEQEQIKLEKLEKEFSGKLKSSILQEAIQGKLVPQLESEPEVEQIGEAPEDVPFAIPEKWKWVRVSDVAHTNPKVTAQTSSTEVSFIPMAALSAGYTSQITLDAKRSWGTVKNGYTKFTNGDVLLAKITPCFQNRKSAIAKKLSNGIGCGSSEFHVLRVSKKYVTQEYLLMFLKSQWFITYGVENFKGTAGQQRLGTSDLKNCLFPLPPLSEQHRIVEKLNELLGSVSQLEHSVSVP